MYCVKNKSRNLNSIFEVISCNGCSKYKDDEVILIGKQVIKIYPIFKGCITIKYDIISECFSERLIRMLEEVSEYVNNYDDYIFIWSNDGESEFIYNLGLLDSFINQGLNFVIIY